MKKGHGTSLNKPALNRTSKRAVKLEHIDIIYKQINSRNGKLLPFHILPRIASSYRNKVEN